MLGHGNGCYFSYPSMPTSIIDDQDLSNVQYTGNWVRGGSAHEHDGTVASSTVVGDSFNVTFNGTDITVYGTLDSTSGGVVTSYSVDGAPAAQVTTKAGSGDTYNQQFWKSPALSTKEHNLVVKMVNVNANAGPGEGTIWFDYFMVTNSVQTTPSPTPTPTPTKAVFHRKSGILGPVVGGIVAGLACLVVVIFCLLYFLRRRRRTQPGPVSPVQLKQEVDSTRRYRAGPNNRPLLNTYSSAEHLIHNPGTGGARTHNYAPVPPPIPSTPPSNYSNYSYSSTEPLVYNPGISGANNHVPAPPSIPSTAPSSYNAPLGQPVLFYQNQTQNPSLSAVNSHPLVSPPSSSYAASTVASQGANTSSDRKGPTLTLAWMPEPEPIQHVDSGVRVDAPGGKPVELPPVYSAQ